jgi:hypothetical protein
MGRNILVNIQNTRLKEICPIGVAPLFADRQARLRVAFHICFAEAPKMTVHNEL